MAAAVEEKLPCPRCNSNNTRFCYFNNYNTKQPRHFCKGCRRYWTKGGRLHDIPIGGGYRKGSKRQNEASSSSSIKHPNTHQPEMPRAFSQPLSQPQPLFSPEHAFLNVDDFHMLNFSGSFTQMLTGGFQDNMPFFQEDLNFYVGAGRNSLDFDLVNLTMGGVSTPPRPKDLSDNSCVG